MGILRSKKRLQDVPTKLFREKVKPLKHTRNFDVPTSAQARLANNRWANK